MNRARTEPWGTPDCSRTILLSVWPILTCRVLPVNHDEEPDKDRRKALANGFMQNPNIPDTVENFLVSKNIMMVGSGYVACTDLV